MTPLRLDKLRPHLADAERVAILGIGSSLRGDDAAGLLTAAAFRTAWRATRRGPRVRVFLGETAPENLTGEIKRFAPTHLVILDAADFGASPGAMGIIAMDDPTANASLSTHSLPVRTIADYLNRFFPCHCVVLGTQPAACAFGAAPSAPVQKAARAVARRLVLALTPPRRRT